MMSAGAVLAKVHVTTIPIDPRQEPKEIEAGIQVCLLADLEDAIKSWSVELHLEDPASVSEEPGNGSCSGRAPGAPKYSFHAEAVFSVAAVLTHLKSRCETWKGGSFMKAVRLPETLSFMPGDRARVEVRVYTDSSAQVPLPSITVFEEERPSSLSPALGSRRFGLSGRTPPGHAAPVPVSLGRVPTRPIGLFY